MNLSQLFPKESLRDPQPPRSIVIARNRAQPVLEDCHDLVAELEVDGKTVACDAFQRNNTVQPHHSWTEMEDGNPFRFKEEGEITVTLFRVLLGRCYEARNHRFGEHEIIAQYDDDDEPWCSFKFSYETHPLRGHGAGEQAEVDRAEVDQAENERQERIEREGAEQQAENQRAQDNRLEAERLAAVQAERERAEQERAGRQRAAERLEENDRLQRLADARRQLEEDERTVQRERERLRIDRELLEIGRARLRIDSDRERPERERAEFERDRLALEREREASRRRHRAKVEVDGSPERRRRQASRVDAVDLVVVDSD